MRSQRAPWWVLAVAAAFLSFYALLVYCDVRRPEDEGFHLRPVRAGLAVDLVHPGTPAHAAGIRAGDVIVSADGHRLPSRLEWSTVRANGQLGRATRLDIARDGHPLTLDLGMPPASWRRWTTRGGFGLLVAYTVQGITLALGIIILVRRQDPVERLGAWLLCCLGVFVVALPARLFTVWRGFPDLAREALWLPFVSTAIAPAVLLSFFLSFPVRRVRSAWLWAAVWLPLVAASIAPLRYQAMALYHPEAQRPASGQGALLATTVGYVLATGIVVLFGYRTLQKDDERRRVRVLAIGPVAACIAGLPAVVGYWMTGGPLLLFESSAVGIAAFLMLLVPLSFAYAILEHRLFDISFIVRQSVRYAAARRVLLSLVPAMIALLAIDLYTHRDEALAEVFATRGTVYLLLAAAALVAHRERHRWLDALDRRFFRERFDAQRLLAKLADEVASSDGPEQAATKLAARIHLALHPTFAVVLVREGGGADTGGSPARRTARGRGPWPPAGRWRGWRACSGGRSRRAPASPGGSRARPAPPRRHCCAMPGSSCWCRSRRRGTRPDPGRRRGTGVRCSRSGPGARKSRTPPRTSTCCRPPRAAWAPSWRAAHTPRTPAGASRSARAAAGVSTRTTRRAPTTASPSSPRPSPTYWSAATGSIGASPAAGWAWCTPPPTRRSTATSR